MRGSIGDEVSFGAGPTSGRGGVRALSRQHVQQRLGLDMWGMRDGEGVEVGIVGLLDDMSSRYDKECMSCSIVLSYKEWLRFGVVCCDLILFIACWFVVCVTSRLV